jgi:hypothetical protein
MKVALAISLLLAVASSVVSAFAPSTPFVITRANLPSTARIHAAAGPEEEEGLDLDLEEMFDM